MGFAEGDQSALGCVASVPCEEVSAAALEDAKFVRGFVRACATMVGHRGGTSATAETRAIV